jgi:P4 family phage/plasmid primase-like protien
MINPPYVKPNPEVLFEKLSAEHGPPAYCNSNGELSHLNEVFWTELIAAERIIIREREEESFFVYRDQNGAHEYTTEHLLKHWLSDRIAQASREWSQYSGLGKLNTDRNRRAVVALLRGRVEKRDYFANRPWAIHCQNTMVVMENGIARAVPFSPAFRSRNRLQIHYDPKAKCPRFIKELLQPAVSTDDMILLQKMFGLIVLGVNRPQRIWILSGEPNTGKTTLGRLITHLIGHWNYAELRTDHLSGRFETSRAFGKTLLFGPDVKSHFLESDGAYRLKSLVGGDPLNAERKCSNEDFPFFGDLNVLITSNARLLVRLEGDVGAWLRRLVIILYNGTPPEKRIDQFYKVLLQQEGPGILNWAIEGLIAYEKDHAQTGDVILTPEQKARVSALLSESDGLRQFINEEIMLSEARDLSREEIIAEYALYAKERGWRPLKTTLAASQVRDLILELFGIPEINSIKRNGKSTRGYHGICFKP